ncbi:MAG: glutaminase [Luteibaculaceae bacterium]
MNYQQILEEIYHDCKEKSNAGKVADYIPELANISPTKFGICLIDVEGNEFSIGDCYEKFSIQSIVKVLSLAFVYAKIGGEVWRRVGVEPSGNPFNSIVQLEYEKGIPRNPFINAGAIVITDIMMSEFENAKTSFLDYVRNLADNQEINYNNQVADSEASMGYKNSATANMLKFYGNLNHNINDVLNFYYLQCSIEMSCKDLAKVFLNFAHRGKPFKYNNSVLTESQVKRINALMQTCGFYDEAGEFSYRVGLPGKSGVGGGIVAVCPKQYSITVWSPKLNNKGNSVKGLQTLEQLTTKTGYSIF